MSGINKIKEILERNGIKYVEKDDELNIFYPYLLADSEDIVINIKEVGDQIYLSDKGCFLRSYNQINDKASTFFDENDIKINKNELISKILFNIAYFEIEKFVKCLIKADFMMSGECV